MPRYPHTRLYNDPYRTVVLSGPHIQVLDTQSGHILFSTVNFAREDEEGIMKSGPIRCSGMSKDGRYLATTGDDKRLKIWDLESLTLLSARALQKKPTSIEFSRSMEILVSDKFGDVLRYMLHPHNKPGEEKSCDALALVENPSGGELVLGHTSLLTACLLTPDEKYIITADRDEHVRVSWYPEGYIIESYCLGHMRYVSAIHIPAASPTSLISGGGDFELKVWEWMTGSLQRDIIVFAAVQPFMKVATQNRRHEISNESFSTTTTIFVVRRISSFLLGRENHVVFSVIGATAIFDFIMEETDDQPDIRHHDFGRPVVDFTVCGEGTIWVLLDADFFEESDVTEEHPHKLVQVVQWSVDQFVDATTSALLESLNTICSLPATAEDLKHLHLYSDLSSLPKRTDGEQERQMPERSKSMHQPVKDAHTGQCAPDAVTLTKRALGRLKHKRALNQLHHEEVDNDDPLGLNTKRMRSDSDNEDLHCL